MTPYAATGRARGVARVVASAPTGPASGGRHAWSDRLGFQTVKPPPAPAGGTPGVASDPDEHVEQLRPFLEAATHVVFHSPAADQVTFIRRYEHDILPRLRKLLG